MGYVVLYMSVLAVGYFLGSKLRDQREKMGFLDGLTNFCVSLLVFVMGIKMGSMRKLSPIWELSASNPWSLPWSSV